MLYHHSISCQVVSALYPLSVYNTAIFMDVVCLFQWDKFEIVATVAKNFRMFDLHSSGSLAGAVTLIYVTSQLEI